MEEKEVLRKYHPEAGTTCMILDGRGWRPEKQADNTA